MSYIGQKPAERVLTSADISDAAITAAKLASSSVTQPKINGGVAGTGPAFSAYSNANQTVSTGVQTKVPLNTEVFDTNNCYDSTTNYRFTPNVAGYYQFNVIGGASATSSLTFNYISLYKNGTAVNLAVYGPYAGTSSYGNLTALIYLNGTTDYVELYVRVDGSGTLSINGSTPPAATFMSASLVRAA